MGEPCVQAPTILKIDAKVDRVMAALEVLAVQKNEISHLIKTQGDHREWLKGHEGRLQSLEQQPGQIAGKILLVLGGAAGAFLSGLVIYAMTRGVS